MSQVYSFAEESCWKGETFREIRRPVVFRAFSIGRNLGEPFMFEFESDYAIWYDQEDSTLLEKLVEARPDVPWATLVLHKKVDQSGIDIFETENDRLVARVEVRRYEGRKITDLEADLGDNVIRFWEIPERLELLRSEKERKRRVRERSRRSRESRDGEK